MTRFLLDVMCGGLIVYLRMCGHDTAYAGDRGIEADDAILELASKEDRTLITRDVALAERTERAILLRARDVEDQLAELAAAGVALELAPEPGYCGACNGRLERVEDRELTPEYAPDTSETAVWRCQNCEQHFWKGSHWDRVRGTLSRIRERE